MNRKKILVVDDQQSIANALRLLLEDEGYDVQMGHDGHQALDLARSFLPDLLIIDVMMPKMDGFDVVAELRDDPEFDDLYIIIMTAKGSRSTRKYGADLRANEFITKPFDYAELIRRINMRFGM